MKTRSHTDDLISKDDRRTISDLLEFDNNNFVEQAKLCKLDPGTDFQQLDLADVDFSNCDLRGFNFSGSDLRGAFGVNVTWEIGNPVLDGADTSDSLFSHELEQQKYFREHPDDLALVERLSTDYWANAISHVADLLQSARGGNRAAMIAHAVFAKHKNGSVRTNILLLMRSIAASSSEHRSFIFHLLSRSWNDPVQTLSCINALKSSYGKSRHAFNLLLKYLTYPEAKIRKSVFFALLGSPHFKFGFKEIRSYVLNCDDHLQRRAFVGASGRVFGRGSDGALYDYRAGNFIDFREVLSPQMLVDTQNPRAFAAFVHQAREQKSRASLGILQVEFSSVRFATIRHYARVSGVNFKYDGGNGKVIVVGRDDEAPHGLISTRPVLDSSELDESPLPTRRDL